MRLSLRRRVRPKPIYGIDRPNVIRNFLLLGCAALTAGFLFPRFQLGGLEIYFPGPTLLAAGCLSLILCASMLAYALFGKNNVRDRMIGTVKWRGDEAVLDIGTGLGLVAIGAAKRLRSGTVTAIDAHFAAGSEDGMLEQAQRNAEIEGVQNRVAFRIGDALDIEFVDGSFDAVFCLNCLSTIPRKSERTQACREIVRVLKPRGIAIVAEQANAAEYVQAFQAAGLKIEGPRPFWRAYSALSIVIARKK